jgi:hypothetical protein
MWLPWYLPQSQIDKMQDMGLKLPANEIFSANQNSIKDAIVSLDHGSCTGCFISKDGLILTNHHCAYSEIQQHSSVKNDYLKKGFWARSPEDELPNKEKTATLLIDARDLTPLFKTALKGISGRVATQQIIDSLSTTILDTLSIPNEYKAEIKDFYYQNQFYLLITQTFRDVRLVAAPPGDIAQFGGEDDNWMWPRHSADFAFYRIYTSPDGKPADYHSDNVPYHPGRVLSITTDGINKGDFTMTLGYPGNTQRYITSIGIKETHDLINPVIADVRGIRQKIWEKNMRKSHSVGIQYADKFASSSNYYKYAIGQNKSIEEQNLITQRQKEETQLSNWIDSMPEIKTEYGNLLTSNRLLYLMRKKLTKTTFITLESLINGPEIGTLVIKAFNLYSILRQDMPSSEKAQLEIENLKRTGNKFFKDFSPEIDKQVFKAMIDYYQNNLDDSLQIEQEKLFGQYKDIKSLVNNIYSNSYFSSVENFEKLLQKPSVEKLENDAAFAFYRRVFKDFGPVYTMFNRFEQQIDYSMHRYLKVLTQRYPERDFYPDANSSLRLSFGKVSGYSPADGIFFSAFSTYKGLIEKNNSGNKGYKTETNLKDLFNNNISEFSKKGEELSLCFISDNDITGGNSGSPVLNGKGEIVGLAFDGNWEGMASDLSFTPDYQRCINVDIRYILYITRHLGNAPRLLNEIILN